MVWQFDRFMGIINILFLGDNPHFHFIPVIGMK